MSRSNPTDKSCHIHFNKNIYEERMALLCENLQELVSKNKLALAAAYELSFLEVEQEWVYKFYLNHSILPTTAQAKLIRAAFARRKLTLAELGRIMKVDEIGKPQKIVFAYADFAPYFPEGMPANEMKQAILKIVHFWKNRRA